jgi:hypothetical protein
MRGSKIRLARSRTWGTGRFTAFTTPSSVRATSSSIAISTLFGPVVLRDLELEVAMGSAVTMYIPAFLRYDLGLRALSATAPITLGDNDPLDLAELVEQLDGASWTKVISAGRTVAVSVNFAHGRGIMFADVAWRGNAIDRIRYFPA